MHGSDPLKCKSTGFTPEEKITDRPMVRPARVRIPDLRRKKFNEPQRSAFSGRHDDGRDARLDIFGHFMA